MDVPGTIQLIATLTEVVIALIAFLIGWQTPTPLTWET
jgi:hypothetical protein